MIRNLFVVSLIWLLHISAINALSVTPSVNNLICGTTPVTFTFDCAFTGNVLFTSSSSPSVSYSIMPGLVYNVVNGAITFDVTVVASNSPGNFTVNFLVLNTNMPGCAAIQDAANTTVNFNCVLPLNDDCSGAISLPIATNSCIASSYGTLSTTTSPISNSCAFPGWVDLWYTFTANNDTIELEVIDAPGFLGIYSLYSGAGGCAALGSPIICGNIVPTPGSKIFTGLTVNDVYYLQILFNPVGNGTAQQICLHSTTAQPPGCPSMVMLTGIESGMIDTESMDFITSDQILLPSSVIDYDAADYIELLPNFEVQLGAMFHAFIDGCGGAMIKEDKETVIKE